MDECTDTVLEPYEPVDAYHVTNAEAEQWRADRLAEQGEHGWCLQTIAASSVGDIRWYLEQRRQRIAQGERAWSKLMEDRPRYRDCRLDNFVAETDAQRAVLAELREFARYIRRNATKGRNLVLFGASGTGKDHIMASLLHAAVTDPDLSVPAEALDPLCVTWLRGVDLYRTAKEDLGYELRPVLYGRQYNIVAISDPVLSGDSLAWYNSQRLYQILDDRHNKMQSTFVSVNCNNRTELNAMLGVATADRLIANATCLFFDWPSYRQPA